jgi:hypothetical protein
MDMEHYRVIAVPLPLESGINRTYSLVNLADAYYVELPTGVSANPEL